MATATNNHSHNTPTPGDVLQSPDANAPLILFESSPLRALAVADLTSAYGHEASRMTQGLALLDRARVLVQDDVVELRPGTPLTWQMLTGARVRIDGRRATLTQNGKTLRVEILALENIRFEMKPARPPAAAENQNDGITALFAMVPATSDCATDVRLAVLLSPRGHPMAGIADSDGNAADGLEIAWLSPCR